jgi:hypothetical protein
MISFHWFINLESTVIFSFEAVRLISFSDFVMSQTLLCSIFFFLWIWFSLWYVSEYKTVLCSESKVVYNCQHTDFKSEVSATVRVLSASNIHHCTVFSLADDVDVQLMEQCFLVHLLEVNIYTKLCCLNYIFCSSLINWQKKCQVHQVVFNFMTKNCFVENVDLLFTSCI